MKILLIQIKRIGDLILTTPAVAAIRRKFPDAQISLVVAHGSRELLPGITGLTKVIVAKGTFRDARRWLQLLGGGYDCCIDFTGNDRSAFLTSLSRAPQRITHARVRQSRLRAVAYNELVESPVRLVHTVDHHLALLAPLGIKDALPAVSLTVPKSCDAKAAELLQKAGVTGPFVVIHPGSARAEKYWLAERWAELIDQGRQLLDLDCVLTGGTSAMEQAHIAEIKNRTHKPFADLSGRVDLLTLAAIIRRAKLLLGVDSAPMHLAAAMQTPQITLFGPTNPFHWRPRGAPSVILHASGQEPLADFSPDHPGAPMNEISTVQVINAMETLLSTPVAPAL